MDQGDDVADTEKAVKCHHPVKEGLFGSCESKVKDIAIGEDYQNVRQYTSCQKFGIIAIINKNVFYYFKVNIFINALIHHW